MSNVATFKAIMELTLAGNYEGIRGYVAEDFVLSEPEPLPYGGLYHGPQGFVDLTYAIRKWYKVDSLGTVLTEVDNNMLLCEFDFGFTSLRTGERLDLVRAVDIFRFDDEGKFLRGDVYYEDPSKLAAIA